ALRMLTWVWMAVITKFIAGQNNFKGAGLFHASTPFCRFCSAPVRNKNPPLKPTPGCAPQARNLASTPRRVSLPAKAHSAKGRPDLPCHEDRHNRHPQL